MVVRPRKGFVLTPGQVFMREELPKVLDDARQRGHGAGYIALETPIRGWRAILKSYFHTELIPRDQMKLQELAAAGYKFEVNADVDADGRHYWRLKVLVQDPM